MAPKWTDAQECAMNLRGRDILVSAAAGSGKTATLTERIIRSLLEVDENGRHTADISRMLVVTFTRAAASDMRAKLSKKMASEAANGNARCREQM
ncbi:MAG: UvrD-helicase domain-containing protein, partial [Clostridia bacterium]|nr:UvrD-helicase domain-containing protein [Clostridia bacterium]